MTRASDGDNGDEGEEFGRLLAAIVIAIVVAVAWTIADRQRPRARWVEPALRVLLRYSIALGLAGYAVAKLLPVQFPPLEATALEGRIGDLTPQGLLWTFMQYSRPYSFFGGLMEVVVGLLCFRRTATRGALLCVAVMSNVALMNYAYNVNVKLYSTMILLSAGVLVLYDLPRLVAVLVRNRPAPPAAPSSLFEGRISEPMRWAAKTALVGSVLLSSVVGMAPLLERLDATRSGMEGVWSMTTFDHTGAGTSAPGIEGWRRLALSNVGVAIRFESEAYVRCRRQPHSDSDRVAFVCPGNRRGELKWVLRGNIAQLSGTFDGATISASAQRQSQSYRLLTSRFRWITDWA